MTVRLQKKYEVYVNRKQEQSASMKATADVFETLAEHFIKFSQRKINFLSDGPINVLLFYAQ